MTTPPRRDGAPIATGPALDRRRVLLYAAGLVAIYLVGVVVIIATRTQSHPQVGVLIIMFAPLVGALVARFAGPGVIQWGRLSWWMLAGLVPVATVFIAYALGSPFGLDVANYGVLGKALLLSPIVIVISSVAALGEETGWRGFLWPLMRRRWSFLVSALVIGAVWWIYHTPLIILGWYGSLRGLAAFTVALVGITLFIGVLTDRSRSVWPSVIAHGAWNALVATGFAVAGNASLVVFAGSTFWVGEFGWLAAGGSLVTGALATWWHLSRPMSDPTTQNTQRPGRDGRAETRPHQHVGRVHPPGMHLLPRQRIVRTPSATTSHPKMGRALWFGIPIDVLHAYRGSSATMRVKACSLVPMVNADGPDLDRAETVTLFNDLCLLAPGALIGARVTLAHHRCRPCSGHLHQRAPHGNRRADLRP